MADERLGDRRRPAVPRASSGSRSAASAGSAGLRAKLRSDSTLRTTRSRGAASVTRSLLASPGAAPAAAPREVAPLQRTEQGERLHERVDRRARDRADSAPAPRRAWKSTACGTAGRRLAAAEQAQRVAALRAGVAEHDRSRLRPRLARPQQLLQQRRVGAQHVAGAPARARGPSAPRLSASASAAAGEAASAAGSRRSDGPASSGRSSSVSSQRTSSSRSAQAWEAASWSRSDARDRAPARARSRSAPAASAP